MKIRARGKEGFHHNGRTVFALQYEIEPPARFASAFFIVWLNCEGEHLYGFVRHSDPMRRIVTTKPGETILHNGQPWKVLGMAVWRATGMDGLLSAQEAV